jgi:hypothetical protein
VASPKGRDGRNQSIESNRIESRSSEDAGGTRISPCARDCYMGPGGRRCAVAISCPCRLRLRSSFGKHDACSCNLLAARSGPICPACQAQRTTHSAP